MNSPLRILVLSSEYPPVPGGISRALAAITAGLRARGSRAEVVSMPWRGLGSLVSALQLLARTWRLHRKMRADLVLAGKWTMDGLPAWMLSKLGGPPYVLMVHGTELLSLPHSRLRRALALRIFRSAAGVLANSSYTEDLFRRSLPLPRDFPVLKFSALLDLKPEPASSALAIEGLPDDALLTVSVARLVPRKGHREALDLLAALAEEFPQLHYAFTGTGPLREQLLQSAQRLGLQDRVHSLGWLEDEDLPALYRRAALYLGLGQDDPDDVEGLGLSFIEAGYAGIPVIAGRVGGVGDVIRHGETGYLVDPGKLDEAVAFARELLGNEERRRTLGAAARLWTAAEFHVHDHAADLLAFLEESVARKARPGAGGA